MINHSLVIDESLTPPSNSISLIPARKINENSENTQKCADQNMNPIVIIVKTHRPEIRSRKPPHRYSPSD